MWELVNDPKNRNKGEMHFWQNPDKEPPDSVITVEEFKETWTVSVLDKNRGEFAMSYLIPVVTVEDFDNRDDAILFAINQVEELSG